MDVVCCQVEVSAMGRSLVQRSPTECGVSKLCRPQNLNNEAVWAWVGLLHHRGKNKLKLMLYSFCSFNTWMMEMSGQLHEPIAVPPPWTNPGNQWIRLGGSQAQFPRSGDENNLCPIGNGAMISRFPRLKPSHYTDYATLTPESCNIGLMYMNILLVVNFWDSSRPSTKYRAPSVQQHYRTVKFPLYYRVRRTFTRRMSRRCLEAIRAVNVLLVIA